MPIVGVNMVLIFCRFYIGCDRCQDWFHDHCVGITQKEAEQLDTYICPNCARKDSADPTNLKELNDADYDLLHRLMKSLLVCKMSIVDRDFFVFSDAKFIPNGI